MSIMRYYMPEPTYSDLNIIRRLHFLRILFPSLVTPPGFEPRQTESESVVLPLYYGAL